MIRASAASGSSRTGSKCGAILRGTRQSLHATFLCADPRSLGLFRIGLALVLLADVAGRFSQVDFWYTNDGLLPNHTLLWRPPAEHLFSLFFVASSKAEACAGFAACAAVYVAFLVGFRTRLVHFLVLLCRVSLNSRIPVLENGGDMVINLLCVFTLAMPLGRRFSLDACRAAQHAPVDAEALRRPVVSLAMLGLILQFALIYFFNAVSKQGPNWRDGLAVHYALHQDKLVTGVGVFMRETLPLEAIKALTWGTLATEWLAVALILTPFFVHRARLVAVTLLPCLHSGFALGLHLGNFSWAMIAFYPLLLTPVHWRALERVGLRLGKRCDGLLPRPEPRLAALGRQLRRLVAGSRPPEASRPSPRWRQRRRMLSEAAVGVLMVAIATEIVNDNASVPRWMRVSQPAWAEAIVDYPRLLQGWRMFAPDVGKRDSMIYVDAVTAEGLHVDPYNEVASRQSFPKGDTVPPHMAQSQFFCMYSDRIAMRAYAAYRQAFLEWLLAYPKRTGRPADCLVSLTGYLVIDESPPPGSATRPTPIERIEFLSYTAPAGDACRLRGVGPVASRSD